jgi:hypothetical protein
MRIRTATLAVAVAAVLAVTAVGCDSGGDGKEDIGAPAPSASSPSASSAGGGSSAPAEGEAATGGEAGADGTDSPAPEASGALPPEPTGAARADVMAVVLDVNVGLFKDEEKAIDAARKQCAALDSGVADPDHSAAELFSYNGITPTDEDGSHLNHGLRRTLCPAS